MAHPGATAHIGLLSDRASQPLDEDLPPLVAALEAQGASASIVAWDDPAGLDAVLARLDRLDLLVVRSPWEYHHHADRYLDAIDAMARHVTVLNPPALLRWNCDKRYLEALAAAGVAVVDTTFVAPGEALSAASLRSEADQFVVKPTVSAGSKNTARFRRDQLAAAAALVEALHAQGKTVMIQPYLERVDHDGETALVYLDGVFSHGLRKGPLLQLDAGLVAGTFAVEEMSARHPDAAQRAVAEAVLRTVTTSFGSVPLYARIDLLADTAGRPVLLEAELNEPSLFHLHAPGSAERFAAAILARLAGG